MSSTDKKITLQEGIDWTTSWRANRGDRNVKAFLIPAQDLEGALAEMSGQTGQKYVRAYIGVDDTNTDKLIIVGTEPETQRDGSIIYRDMITDDVTGQKYGGGGSLWDFTQPCPPECDPESPLNGN